MDDDQPSESGSAAVHAVAEVARLARMTPADLTDMERRLREVCRIAGPPPDAG